MNQNGGQITGHEMNYPKWSSDRYAEPADPLLSAAFPEYLKTPALSDSCFPAPN